MAEQRIRNSEHVPGVLSSALTAIKRNQEKRTAAVSAPTHYVQRPLNKLPIKVAMKRRKLIARGSGVFEDQDSGDIWYREGEFLIKQKLDIGDIVEKYLDQCRGS